MPIRIERTLHTAWKVPKYGVFSGPSFLRIPTDYFEENIAEMNEEELPRIELRKKLDFHKEGQKGRILVPAVGEAEDRGWCEYWMVAADLDSKLLYTVVVTA